jgi:hypothetical protein
MPIYIFDERDSGFDIQCKFTIYIWAKQLYRYLENKSLDVFKSKENNCKTGSELVPRSVARFLKKGWW